MSDPADAAQLAEFRSIFERTSSRVYAFARRQVDAATAEDVVSDVYLAAWRRRADLPADPVPWLLVTARNTLRNYGRTRGRQDRVQSALAGVAHLAATSATVDGAVVDRAAMISALSALNPSEREALLLVAWDGLDRSAAAAVAGCSPATFAVRLHRARRALHRQLQTADSTGDDPSPSVFRTTEDLR
ncbi:MAG: sigma-70 family RNA polymerase sigma factor [Actinomycetota bacterium]|nr:sigma-70 family RNA polymerase sigma factor [Actinomycetota bacterium]